MRRRGTRRSHRGTGRSRSSSSGPAPPRWARQRRVSPTSLSVLMQFSKGSASRRILRSTRIRVSGQQPGLVTGGVPAPSSRDHRGCSPCGYRGGNGYGERCDLQSLSRCDRLDRDSNRERYERRPGVPGGSGVRYRRRAHDENQPVHPRGPRGRCRARGWRLTSARRGSRSRYGRGALRGSISGRSRKNCLLSLRFLVTASR